MCITDNLVRLTLQLQHKISFILYRDIGEDGSGLFQSGFMNEDSGKLFQVSIAVFTMLLDGFSLYMYLI